MLGAGINGCLEEVSDRSKLGEDHWRSVSTLTIGEFSLASKEIVVGVDFGTKGGLKYKIFLLGHYHLEAQGPVSSD